MTDRHWALDRLDGLAALGAPLDYDDWHKAYRPLLTGTPTTLDHLGITDGAHREQTIGYLPLMENLRTGQLVVAGIQPYETPEQVRDAVGDCKVARLVIEP